jgi:hypothetical protein
MSVAMEHASLRRRIGELIGNGHHCVSGRHVDDRAVDGPFNHVFRHRTAQHERAPQIDPQNSIEVFSGYVENRARYNDTSVVEQDVALAEALDAPHEKSFTVSLLAHIRLDRERVRACIPGDGRRGLGTQFRKDIGHDHIGAVFGEGSGTRCTDATGRARDDGGLAG